MQAPPNQTWQHKGFPFPVEKTRGGRRELARGEDDLPIDFRLNRGHGRLSVGVEYGERKGKGESESCEQLKCIWVQILGVAKQEEKKAPSIVHRWMRRWCWWWCTMVSQIPILSTSHYYGKICSIGIAVSTTIALGEWSNPSMVCEIRQLLQIG